jgi:HSP20 family protein
MTALIPVLREHGWLNSPRRDFFDRFFEDFGWPSLRTEEKAFVPVFDVSETDSALIVKAEVPGIDQKDMDISLSNGLLTIKGEKKLEKKEDNEQFHSLERSYGAFSRTFRLPVEIDTEKVDASYKDGVLTVTLPKIETAQPRKIEVKS